MSATNTFIEVYNNDKKQFFLVPMCDFMFYERLKEDKYKPQKPQTEHLKAYNTKEVLVWGYERINLS